MNELIIPILSGVFAGGMAWGAVKASLNGTRKAISDTRDDVGSMREDVADVRERVSRIEGQMSAQLPPRRR